MKHLLPLLFLLVSSAVLADSGSYRVEVIVLRNLLTAATPLETSELRSFSKFPVPEDNRPSETTSVDRADASGEQAVSAAGPDLRGIVPDELRAITGKSNTMDNAWRRLQSSTSYQPLVYTAWEQSRIDYHPPVRIHDLQVIASRLQPPTSVMLADLTAPDPLADYRSTFYQLDGSLQLRRSRFLHLYLDLEIREPVVAGPVNAGFPGVNRMQAGTQGTPELYSVFRLMQNRQISTGEMQYFDTPYFGALVYVTSVEPDRAPQ